MMGEQFRKFHEEIPGDMIDKVVGDWLDGVEIYLKDGSVIRIYNIITGDLEMEKG